MSRQPRTTTARLTEPIAPFKLLRIYDADGDNFSVESRSHEAGSAGVVEFSGHSAAVAHSRGRWGGASLPHKEFGLLRTATPYISRGNYIQGQALAGYRRRQRKAWPL